MSHGHKVTRIAITNYRGVRALESKIGPGGAVNVTRPLTIATGPGAAYRPCVDAPHRLAGRNLARRLLPRRRFCEWKKEAWLTVPGHGLK